MGESIFDTAEVKRLKKEWYQRLEDEGFKEIENVNHPNSPLLAWHSFIWQKTCPEQKSLIESYYFKARALLHTFEFESESHRLVWELHAEGLSRRQIEKAIATSPKPYKREYIGTIIKLIAEEIK